MNEHQSLARQTRTDHAAAMQRLVPSVSDRAKPRELGTGTGIYLFMYDHTVCGISHSHGIQIQVWVKW